MKSHYLRLFAYEKWANLKIIQAMQQVVDLPERAKEIFSHVLSAQKIWCNRLIGDYNPIPVWGSFPIEKWVEICSENAALLDKFVREIPESDFQRLIAYTNSKGDAFQTSIEDILTQLSHHAAYHRGQIIVLIKPFLQELPATDYIFYTREKEAF